MKYIKQFALILAISFVGEVLGHLIPLPVPAGIYGIVILFTLLQTGVLPLSAVEETGDFLLEIMPLMFIPAIAELFSIWSGIKNSVVAYLAVSAVSTVLVMVVSGWVTQGITKLRRSRDERDS